MCHRLSVPPTVGAPRGHRHPANTFAQGTLPNASPWGFEIPFTTPYTYGGGNLVLTLRHLGGNLPSTLFCDGENPGPSSRTRAMIILGVPGAGAIGAVIAIRGRARAPSTLAILALTGLCPDLAIWRFRSPCAAQENVQSDAGQGARDRRRARRSAQEPPQVEPSRLVMFGNGITMDLVRSIGLPATIAPSELIPPPFDERILVQYKPGGPVHEVPLWSNAAFPQLWTRWAKKTNNGSVAIPAPDTFFAWLCRSLSSDGNMNVGRNAGTFIADVYDSSPSTELRAYLMHFFRFVDRRLRACTWNWQTLWRWKWVHRIRWLGSQCPCTFVSYNYDVVVEELLQQASGGDVVYVGMEPEPMPEQAVPLLKPHGSISWAFPVPFRDVSPWLSGNRNRIENVLFTPGLEYPPGDPPAWPPDLVPPGHLASQSIFPHFDRLIERYRAAMQRAADIVCIGMSLISPDDDELRSICDGELRGRKFYHVVPRHSDDVHSVVTSMRGQYVHCGIEDKEFYQLLAR